MEVVRLRRSEVELVWELLFDVLDAEYLEEGRVDDWRVDLVLSEEVVPHSVEKREKSGYLSKSWFSGSNRAETSKTRFKNCFY